MVGVYQVKDIDMGPSSYNTGHVTYLKARYKPNGEKIICKENKHGIPLYSRLEVSFSQLAQLFLSRDLAPEELLIVDDKDNVIGIAVKHLCYLIAKKEKSTRSFYQLVNPEEGFNASEHKIADPTAIKYYFLNELPQNFYGTLVQQEKDKKITIDYESLASILTTSYTMEEDDLHKGNFGFYMVQKNGKPHAVFFKIDHDLMFVDSIMAFQTRRPFHLFHGPKAFDINAEDLIAFPNLKHSSNSYWPTKFGYIADPFNKKEYRSFAEIEAFSRLETNKDFIRGKWKSLYKHILVPTALIEKTLMDCADINNPSDRAHIALITNAMVARLANLRATLFAIKEFRDFVANLDGKENQAILREITPKGRAFKGQVGLIIKKYREFCTKPDGFEEGDTPLHTAIKLGDYRYEDTFRMYGHFLNTKNKAGKTPLDIARERVHIPLRGADDVRKNMRFIMKHLIDNGAKKKHASDAKIAHDKLPNPYVDWITSEMTYAEIKDFLKMIGEDHTFCLKHKKQLAIECIQQWTNVRRLHPDFKKELRQLKNDINGTSPEAQSVDLKYIRQLRSKLWIVRQLRGFYGRTTSQNEINHIIDQQLKRLKSKKQDGHSFFSCSKKDSDVEKGEEIEMVSLKR